MTELQGTCDARYQAVAETLSANLDAGLDVGASVAVFLDGEPVVDLWGGHLDAARTVPWARDTITNVFSTTKTMTALCALLLADRGELDLHAPVARYWPAFAAQGKERVEVRHLLGHTAGLPGWDVPLDVEDLADWERCTSLLADQAPWWEPGTASGYHAVTQGYLVGEVVRRVTGRTLGTFFREEIAAPLGADFHIGLTANDDPRVAPLIAPETAEAPPPASAAPFAARVLGNPPITGATSWATWWRRCEIPAANGHGNARSVAAVQSVLACGGTARGVQLLSEQGCRRVFEEQSNGTDLILGVPMRFGLGFGLSSEVAPLGPGAIFWGGYGGSVVYADLDARLCVSYVMNKMEANLVGDPRGLSILVAAAAA